MAKLPKLSIVMMSYNQGIFIGEAIESVLAQEIVCDWELLIGDDASQDNTAEIVNEYINRYPDKINYFKHSSNIGLHANYIFLINQCKGEYIALLEADDYWIDPNKINVQIDFMDKHPDLAWTFTNGCLVNTVGDITQKISYDLPPIFDLEYYLKHFFNPMNNTIVFRRSSEPQEYPDFFKNVAQWDTVLHYLRSLKGNIGYVSIDGLAWRRHEGATSFTNSFSGTKRYMDWLIINKNIQAYLPKKLHQYFKSNSIAYEFISISYYKQKRYSKFFKYFFQMILNKPFRSFRFYRDYLWKLKND